MYGHNLCPFATRARYAFALKEVPFQHVEMDLNEKAKWHLDFNNGFVPVLETPDGTLIKESAVIAQVAIETNHGKGVDIVPKCPIEAAKMRLAMQEYDKFLQPFYGVYMCRGEDPEKNKLLIPTLEAFNNLLEKAGPGKYLLGTEHPTQMDVWYAPFLETLCDWGQSAYANVHDDCEFEKHGALIKSYIELFRAHPLIAPLHMSPAACKAHTERSRGWEKGVKCQLTTSYLS